ncbi:MAG: acetyltransferase [Pseudomonadota bacterium]
MTKLGIDPVIHPTATVTGSTFGRYCEVGTHCVLTEVAFGDYSYCSNYAMIAYATVGKFSNIAAMCRINGGNHPTWRASLHHFQYRSAQYWEDAEDDAEFFQWRRDHWIEIGHDTWLGHGAQILPGRNIGHGAVVASGAIVTKDVAPYAIVGGNPAREIRSRFSGDVAERLMALAWWDWDHDRIGAALGDFRTLTAEGFLEKYE